MDISVVNSWIIYKINFPFLTITTQKLLHERLVEELIQPLLILRADVTCPKHLHTFSAPSVCFGQCFETSYAIQILSYTIINLLCKLLWYMSDIKKLIHIAECLSYWLSCILMGRLCPLLQLFLIYVKSARMY